MLAITPLWTDDVTAIFTASTAGILAVSAFLALRQLREAQRTRYSDLIVTMTERWAEPGLLHAQAETAKLRPDEVRDLVKKMWSGKAQQADEDRYYALISLPNFIEVIAATDLTLEAIDELWGGAILMAWDKWEEALGFVREQKNASRVLTKFEALAQAIRELRSRPHRPPLPLMSPGGLSR